MKSRSRTAKMAVAESRVFVREDGCFLPNGEAPKSPLPPCGGGLGWGVLGRRSMRNKSGVNKQTRRGQIFNTPGLRGVVAIASKSA